MRKGCYRYSFASIIEFEFSTFIQILQTLIFVKISIFKCYPTEMEALMSDVENVSPQDLNNTEGWEHSKSIINSLILCSDIKFKYI